MIEEDRGRGKMMIIDDMMIEGRVEVGEAEVGVEIEERELILVIRTKRIDITKAIIKREVTLQKKILREIKRIRKVIQSEKQTLEANIKCYISV